MLDPVSGGAGVTRQKVVDAINRMTDYRAGGLVAGINWTTAHGQDPPEGCSVVSKIEHGTFVPTFGEPGKPFRCLQANPLPDKLQSKPTNK